MKIKFSPAVRQVLHDYWQQYKAHPWQTFFAFTIPAIGNIFVFFVPPLIVAKLINLYASQKVISLTSIGGYVGLFAGLWLLGEIFWRIGAYFLAQLKADGMGTLNKEAFNHLSERDYDFYSDNFVGSLTKKAFAFAKGFDIFTETISFNVFSQIFPIIFAVIILWRYSPWIPIILIVCLILVVIIAIPIIRRRAKLVIARHVASSRMVGRLADALTNMLAIKSFAKEKQESKIYDEYVNDFTFKIKKAANFQNFRFDTVISPLYVATNVIGLVFTIIFAQKLNLESGAMLVIFTYYAIITRIFWDINHVYRDIESSISEAAEFTDLFLASPKVQDVSSAKKLKVVNGRVQFSGVNFNYHDGQGKSYFLKDFNLDIKANQKVGLVGVSGSGKTTITRLLLRFIDMQSGQITIDGQDIKNVTQASLREAIAYVPQEPLLFHRTLLENIGYGDERASEKEVVQAAKIAHAHEFIVKLPQGYQTLVGERGIKLSGGQRQRVAIARALIKNSPLLVLDEATSSLDSESEKYIQDGLQKLMKNKTALVIAHRLSTIKNLDRIIVLDHGKVVQDGTHDQLIQQEGIYAKLWSHQSGEFV